MNKGHTAYKRRVLPSHLKSSRYADKTALICQEVFCQMPAASFCIDKVSILESSLIELKSLGSVTPVDLAAFYE